MLQPLKNPAALNTAAKLSRLLSAVIILAGLLPLWTVRHPALFDYPNHLLEAQVVVRYGARDPVYAEHYQIRDNWSLRSNALSTLVMITLGQWLPIQTAGKIALSLYVIVFVGGMEQLLRVNSQPAWLLLIMPLLLYNLTFTAGLINWCYGLALIPWTLVGYERWQAGRSPWAWATLAGLMVLIYSAHVLAWGLTLLVINAVAVADGLPRRRFGQLCVALSAAAPLVALIRPLLMAAPLGLALGLASAAWLIRRLRLRPTTVVLTAADLTLLYLAGVRFSKPLWLVWFPDVDFSLYSKGMALLRTFTLPQQFLPLQADLVAANVALLALLAVTALLLAGWTLRAGSADKPCARRWIIVLGVLAMAFCVIPYRTADIIVTEPRVLLVMVMVGLLAARLPRPGGWPALVVLLAMASLSVAVTFVYAQRYDVTARRWAQTLDSIPPAQRVLVLSGAPTIPPVGWHQLAQFLDGSQFTSIYALEHGGFVSNTFFNGPLLPRQPTLIPPYWWLPFRPAAYVATQCEALRASYPYVVIWQPDDLALLSAVRDCYATQVAHGSYVDVWRAP